MLLMRGSVSPLRTRRSSASEEGRVFVGSRPTRLYIVRTAATSAGGLMRTAASAAASGACNRASRSTTVAPSSHNTPARTIDARSGATESFNGTAPCVIRRSDCGIRLRLRRDDLTHALGKLPGIGLCQIRRVDRLVNNEPDVARIRREAVLQHDVAAADHRYRHHWQPRLEREEEAAALEARHAAVTAARAFGKHNQAQPVRGETRRPAEDSGAVRTAAIHEHVAGPAQMPAKKWKPAQR